MVLTELGTCFRVRFIVVEETLACLVESYIIVKWVPAHTLTICLTCPEHLITKDHTVASHQILFLQLSKLSSEWVPEQDPPPPLPQQEGGRPLPIQP